MHAFSKLIKFISAVMAMSHCTLYRISAHLQMGFKSAEKVGQEEVGGVTCNVLCTWWLPGLRSYKVATVGSEWAISHPSYMNRLGKVSRSINSQKYANHLLLVQFSAQFLVTSKFIQFAQRYNETVMEETLELKATHRVTMILLGKSKQESSTGQIEIRKHV